MLKDNKKSFFERLTGNIVVDDEDENIDIDTFEAEEEIELPIKKSPKTRANARSSRDDVPVRRSLEENEIFIEEDENSGELSVDLYQTDKEIIIEAMVAGVKPQDLHISITRDMVTIRGRREANNTVNEDDYFYRELFWGTFTRTIMLPHEVEIESAEAVEKHGLLIIRMPKIDKARQSKLTVKSI